MILIRPMIAEDLPLAMRLKCQAGWNQTLADWRRFQAMQPQGCMVAELEGVAVGTVVVTAFDAVAWISMVLVEESVRGRGVGKALMVRAVQEAEELGCTTIRLDATSLGQPLYETLGFVPQYELTRYAGVAEVLSSSSSDIPQGMRVASPEDMQAILALDSSVTSTQRGKFLSRLFAEAPAAVRVVEMEGQIAGYLSVRPGSDAIQMGPCIANANEIGSVLVVNSLARFAGSPVYWDFPSGHSSAAQLARSVGLAPQRQFLRMCRGERVNDDVAKLWASSGPELG